MNDMVSVQRVYVMTTFHPRRTVCSAILMLAIMGCVTTPKGNQNPPTGGYTTLYLFAPPGEDFRMFVYDDDVDDGVIAPHNGATFEFSRNSSLDNFERPAGIPANFVAYSTGSHLFHPFNYCGELERKVNNNWVFCDGVDTWNGSREYQLIHE
jgi:hypothetical protein